MFCSGVSAGFRGHRSAAEETWCGKYEEDPPGKGLGTGRSLLSRPWAASEPPSESPCAGLGQQRTEVHLIISERARQANKLQENFSKKLRGVQGKGQQADTGSGTTDEHR